MSAFAALKTQDAASMFFSKVEETEVIEYQPNSSDSEAENETNSRFIDTVTPREQSEAAVGGPSIHGSNFSVTEENCIIQDDSVLLGLKEGEFLMVVGQFKLSVLKGAILINQQHYTAASSGKEHLIIAPQSQSLPMISSARMTDNDKEMSETQPTFLGNYTTIIKLGNHFTGLENIGSYHAPFKRFFTSKLEEDDNLDVTPVKHSFEIVVTKSEFNGLAIDKTWSRELQKIKQQAINSNEAQIIMIIGNKNSGKSTFAKSLLNELVTTSNTSFLDLDPGQSEFSPPYCLTLSSVKSEIFGMNLPIEREDNLVHYFGFTTPLSQPQLYIIIITKLLNEYLTIHKPKGNHLIINTPGWVKGYGKEILLQITKMINPSKLVLLSSSLDLNSRDNLEILSGLSFDDSSIIQGIFQTSKYSPSQLRTINKLIYFHSPTQGVFNFANHILNQSPRKISYQTTHSGTNFLGINCISMLNFDATKDFEISDALMMLDSSIVGMYVIENELFHTFSSSVKQFANTEYPFYLDFTNYLELITNDGKIDFMGLSMVHSIDLEQGSFNLYIPDAVRMEITRKLSQGYKLLLVKGEGEVPNCELLNKDILIDTERTKRTLAKRYAGKTSKPTDQIPYITLDGKPKHGGVWRIRRNVMRRGQQN